MTVNRILFVDDEPALLAGIGRHLRGHFQFDTATNGAQALEMIAANGPYAVLVTDMRMPTMDGLSLLDQARKMAPEMVRLMLTGNTDQGTAVNAINRGQIFSFLNKPCQPDALKAALQLALRQYELVTAEKELLERTLTGAVGTMVDVLATVHPLIFSRATVVRDLALEVGRGLGVSDWVMDMAAMLAPIGWVTVPGEAAARVLALADRAGREDRILAERVPEAGARLLERIPRLEKVAEIVRYQAKRFDGGGIPRDDTGGDRIPLESRILKICHDLVERAGHRSFLLQHLEELAGRKGHYDPDLLKRVTRLLHERAGSDRAAADQAEMVTIERPGQLKRGDRLEDGLIFLDGGLALAAGEFLSEVHIERFTALHAIRPMGFPVRISRRPVYLTAR